MGSARYAVSEQDVNRSMPITWPPPSASAGVDQFDMAAGDADDEQADDEDDEDEPVGPQISDVPVLSDDIPKIMLYCTSCNQNVMPVRYNICPCCYITDSTTGINSPMAQACRESPVANNQYIFPPELRNAIHVWMSKRNFGAHEG